MNRFSEEVEAKLQALARSFDDAVDDDVARVAFIQGWDAAMRWVRQQKMKEQTIMADDEKEPCDYEDKPVSDFIGRETLLPYAGKVISGSIDAYSIMLLDIKTGDGTVYMNVPRTNVSFAPTAGGMRIF